MDEKRSSDGRGVTIARGNDATVEGRREGLRNRDLRASATTAGQMLAIVTSGSEGMGSASGWHYHPIAHQLIYILKGWIDLDVEDGTRTRLEAGDSAVLRGPVRHNVRQTSNEIEVLTVTVPATYEVVMCDIPPGFDE